MGIWAIISGEFGELQGKVLSTTSTVVGTSILGLACGAYLERSRAKNIPAMVVPFAGILCAIVSAAIVLWLIWGSNDLHEETVFKSLAVSLIFAFSFAQLSLLSLARLAAKFRWSMLTAYFSILALALVSSAVILFSENEDNFFVLRLIGVLAVVDAAVTVMIPIFHRLSRSDFAFEETVSTAKIDGQITDLKAQIQRLEKQREKIKNAGDENDAL